MSDWTIERTLKNADGTRAVELRGSLDRNLFRYHVMTWMAAAEEDEGMLGDGYWATNATSGYFDTIKECEADALASVDFLDG